MKLSTFDAFKNIHYENEIIIEGELLKKCQAILLSIAEDIISVCEQNNYWYQLSGGTALGAVRHHGFIPWDDDIDLNVKGNDLEIIGKSVEEKYGEKYKFLYYNTPDYGQPMGKIILRNSIYRDRELIDSKNCGFFIDIFPIENVPDNDFLRNVHGKFCMLLGGLNSCRKFYKSRKFYLDVGKKNPEVRNTIFLKVIIGGVIAFLPLKTWTKLTDWFYGLCKNEKSEFVSIPSGRNHYFGEMYERSGLIETVPVNFEGHQWQIAKNYNDYFTKLYGPDYMSLPPEDKREKHVIFELKFPK